MGFVLLCIIGAFCAMRILVELRSILEPFLWALFLVMARDPSFKQPLSEPKPRKSHSNSVNS